ncbi:hypothetical protein D9M09_14875 [Janthinobacterium agaricidamnosum]|uniref:Uncharacterized protein n=1 Tax=Janthinobacterium agaricidamnosum TaxID=55508 RepID=A0A3G2EBZ0_9BURK|nr:hypothetical protein [Janthinobacterium agaricidamnosum]AYM76939.1 hypothetical protein D9M09_14875 [Janthinobacterium agaricidamnosum]
MHADTIAKTRTFRSAEACSDFALERAFARWVAALEIALGFKLDASALELADELFASDWSVEDAVGEFSKAV